jgi:hypothetical protein
VELSGHGRDRRSAGEVRTPGHRVPLDDHLGRRVVIAHGVERHRRRLDRIRPDIEAYIGSDLYLGTGSPATLVEIGPRGLPVWTQPVSTIFGTANDNPSRGRDVDQIGGLEVGSLGSSSATATSYPIGAAATSGFSIDQGRTEWSDPGAYNCLGPFGIFGTPVICRFRGSIQYRSGSSSPVDAPGVTLTIEGFEPSTGRIEWTQPDTQPLSFEGDGVISFVDSEHVFWCSVSPEVDVTEPIGTGFSNERISTDEFYPCRADGKPAGYLPSSRPQTVGVTIDGGFFWPSPQGLMESPAPS